MGDEGVQTEGRAKEFWIEVGTACIHPIPRLKASCMGSPSWWLGTGDGGGWYKRGVGGVKGTGAQKRMEMSMGRLHEAKRVREDKEAREGSVIVVVDGRGIGTGTASDDRDRGTSQSANPAHCQEQGNKGMPSPDRVFMADSGRGGY